MRGSGRQRCSVYCFSRVWEIGSENVHARFRQHFSKVEYPDSDMNHLSRYEFQRKGNFQLFVVCHLVFY
jgi:hypothetical protein